jgi:hypothetical protein
MVRKAFWINAVVGLMWIGIGLRDAFAPHLFRFDGQVATNSTVSLDFVVGILFLVAAVSLRAIKSTGAHPRH